MVQNTKKAKLTFFKQSGKYYTEEIREYPAEMLIYKIVEDIEQNEKNHPGMHVLLTFTENMECPNLILAENRKKFRKI